MRALHNTTRHSTTEHSITWEQCKRDVVLYESVWVDIAVLNCRSPCSVSHSAEQRCLSAPISSLFWPSSPRDVLFTCTNTPETTAQLLSSLRNGYIQANEPHAYAFSLLQSSCCSAYRAGWKCSVLPSSHQKFKKKRENERKSCNTESNSLLCQTSRIKKKRKALESFTSAFRKNAFNIFFQSPICFTPSPFFNLPK